MANVKLTEEQIRLFGDPENIDIPFEYPDGEENPAAVIFDKHWCREEFWNKWTDLNDFGVNDGYEIDLDKLKANMKKASDDGEASEDDVLLFDYIASEEAWEDKWG